MSAAARCAPVGASGGPVHRGAAGASGNGRPSGQQNAASPFRPTRTPKPSSWTARWCRRQSSTSVVEPCCTAVGPVPDVMGVAAPRVAAREPALVVARLQRPPQRRGNGAGLRPTSRTEPSAACSHDHRPRVAGHPAGGLGGHPQSVGVFEGGVAGGRRGGGPRHGPSPGLGSGSNARFAHAGNPLGRPGLGGLPRHLVDRLRGNVRDGSRRLRGNVLRPPARAGPQRPGVDVQHHLVPVARRAAIQPRGQRTLGHQTERVRLPLAEAGVCRFLRRDIRAQLVARRFQRAAHRRARLG